MKTLAFSIFLILSYSAKSQTYTVEVTQSPYLPLENAQDLVNESWSEPVFAVPLIFSFPFFDDMIDSLFSQDFFAGGYLSTGLNYESTGLLLFFSTDLIDRGYEVDSAMSPIMYKLDGDPGHRVLTIEFQNAGFTFGELSGDVYTDYINIQIKLREESGNIEIHIGPYSVQNPGLDFEGLPGPTIGLIEDFNFDSGDINGEIIFLAGDPLNPDVIADLSPGYLEWPIPENTVYIFNHETTSTADTEIEHVTQFYFPNPTSEFISLNQDYHDKVTSKVSLLSSFGQNVATIDNINKIDLNGFTPGLYFLSFETKMGSVIEKIIIH